MSSSKDVEMTNGEQGSLYKWVDAYTEDLQEPARTGQTSADWDTLRHILKCRINHNICRYLTRTPRPRTTPLAPASSIDSFASEHPNNPESSLHPSTNGGLVLPPWPPKSPRKRNSMDFGGMGGKTDGTGGAQMQSQQRSGGFGGPGEFFVDADAAIGGRTLSANLNDHEAKAARDRIFKLLDNFETDPPFTIQRVCELALNPTAAHKALGKYLRAVEKVLLVTSNWDPLPATTASQPEASSSGKLPSSSQPCQSSQASSGIGFDRSTTPLFSPIPFLIRNGSAEPEGSFRLDSCEPMDLGDGPNPMSLNLDIGPNHSATVRTSNPMLDAHISSSSSRTGDLRGETPPNPLLLASAGVSGGSAPAATNGTSQVSTEREPFMGRVDELDSGPILPSPTTPSDPQATHPHTVAGRQHANGTGESGTMVPHGISEKPQAISSTTTLSPTKSDDGNPLSPASSRKMAPLPRTTSMGNLSDRFIKAEVLAPTQRGEAAGLTTTTAGIDGRHETKRDNVQAAADEAMDGVAQNTRKVGS